MATEEKKYLINVEDNLDEYAKRADEAALKVAELKAKISGLTDEEKQNGEYVEKLNAEYRVAQKEYSQAKRNVEDATKANQAQKRSYQELYQQWKLAEKQLKAMPNAYVLNKDGVMELSDEYVRQSKVVANAKQALDNFGAGVHDNRLKVGSYSEAIKGVGQNMIDMAKNMVGPAAAVATLMAVFNKLKEAIMSTTFAINAMNQAQAISKQLFYDVATTGKISTENIKNAYKAQEELNAVRIAEARINYENADQQREINALRLVYADQTLSETERVEALNKVREIDAEQTRIKVDLLKRELLAVHELREGQEGNEELRIREYQIMTEIRNEQAKSDAAMKEIESVRTAILKKQMEDWKKRNSYLKEGTAEYEKAQDELAKLIVQEYELAHAVSMTKEEFEAAAVEATKYVGAIDKEFTDVFAQKLEEQRITDEEWAAQMAAGREQYARDLEERQAQKDQIDAEDLAKEQEKQAKITEIINAAYAGIQSGADAVFEAKQNRLNAEMEAELSQANLTEQQKVAIRKKYFEQQKKADISQALINAALAISNALATTKPFLPAGLIAGGIAAIQGAAQVAVIKSQRFSGGASSVKEPTAITQSVHQTAQPIGTSIFTQPQFSQQELNELPQWNLTAEDIAAAVRKIPPPIVTVEDINARADQVSKVSVRSNI